MCLMPKKPNIPKPLEPLVVIPEEAKKIELNPGKQTKSTDKLKKRRGTRKLQIPLGGTESGSGLGIPS